MPNPLTIVIPAYNEGENIRVTLAEIDNHIRTPNTVMIVYDRDEDNTIPVVKEYIAQHPARAIRLTRNSIAPGVLNAIKTGLQQAESDVVLVMMADLSDDLPKVDPMFQKVKEGYDLVCASRYMAGGKQIGGPRFKKLLSRFAGMSLYYLTRIPTHDITNSFKMYTRAVLRDIEVESTGGFELGMEITIKAFLRGYRITQLPSTWYDRTAGESHFRLWTWLPRYLHWYFYAIAKSPFRNRSHPHARPE